VRDLTRGNELVTTVTFILAQEDSFTDVKLSFDTYIRFITKISRGYNAVPYHNQTHGADVAQVSHIYCLTVDDHFLK
jgi:hypothetical protein